MLKILINAYACSPGMGSEPGMAWNWVSNLAKHCELFIITEGEFRKNIEDVVPTLEQGKNMHFYYNPLPDKVHKMCWNQGDWRFYWYYGKWQRKTLEIAKEIVKANQIDIVHQLNMIGFREPGLLWKLDKPFVWGPTNAKEAFPESYLSGAPVKKKLFIKLKNKITKFQLIHSSKVRNAVSHASCIFAASSDSVKSLKKYFDYDAVLMNESGCDVASVQPKHHFEDKKCLDLLWVGRFIFTKQLDLALQVMAASKNKNLRLHIVGGSEDEEKAYKAHAAEMGIADMCVWYGKVTHNEVQRLMQNSDVFFFASIAEGTPHVVLEAIANGLPTVCFDTCGHGDVINDKVGKKIPLSSPQKSINEFAMILNELDANREQLKVMSENCMQRQSELTWEEKAIAMVNVYNKIISEKNSKAGGITPPEIENNQFITIDLASAA